MERKVAAGYIRVSSNMQVEEGVSLNHQRLRITQFIQDNNFEMYDIFEDAGISGFSNDLFDNPKSIKRQGMMQLLNAIKHKKINVVIATKNDRLGRDQYEKNLIKRQCRKNDIQIIYLDQPHLNAGSDEPMDRLMDGLMDLLDEFYSLNLSKDMRKTHSLIAKEGLYTGGRVPYGYKLNTVVDKEGKTRKGYVKDEAFAPTVQLIFDLYEEGLGFTRIANHLTEINAPRVEGRWTHQNVSIILKNENYCGRVWNRYESKRKEGKWKDKSEWVYGEGNFETIITKEQFQRVQELMEKRAKNTNRERKVDYDNRGAGIYALTGLVKCSCGRNMSVNRSSSSRSKTVNYYYSCPRNKSLPAKEKCSNNVNVAKIDFLVWKELCKFLTPDNIISKINEFLQTKAQENKAKNKKHHYYKKKIKEVEKQIDNLFQIISTLDLTNTTLIDSYNNRILILQKDLVSLKKSYEELGEPLEEDIKFPEVKGVFKEGLLTDFYYQHIRFEVLQKLFSSLIDKIEIRKVDSKTSEIEIYFRLNHPSIQKLITARDKMVKFDLPIKKWETYEEKHKFEAEMNKIVKKKQNIS